MQIFLNESSFHEQFFDRNEIERAFRIFLRELNILIFAQVDFRFFCDRGLPYMAFSREMMHASLNNLRDKSLTTAIFDALYNRLNILNWRDEQLHSEDEIFVCGEDNVTGTGMAEFAERKLQDDSVVGLLCNFPSSKYSGQSQVNVTKNDTNEQTLECVDNDTQLARWINEHYPAEVVAFDYDSNERPTDLQTVLRDVTRFDRTGQLQSGRHVYREVVENRYWYVDNFHRGRSAHLEVFDAQGKHLGEANLDGVIDYDKRDRNKTIDI